jgi:hypothetical protein
LHWVNKILGSFGVVLSKKSALEKEAAAHAKECATLAAQYQKQVYSNVGEVADGILCVLFSKDRAMQVHALLFSYFHHVQPAVPVVVLYTCSTEAHYQSYNVLQEDCKHLPVQFIKEQNFRTDLLQIIRSSTLGRIFFMTDDGIFKEPVNLNEVLSYHPVDYIFSLRLGSDFTFCYSHNKPQQVPAVNWQDSDVHQWEWHQMPHSPDWSYPLSVDATFFCRLELLMLLESTQFSSPNSLEAKLQQYQQLFIYRKGVCFTHTKYVNIPCNLVQQEYKNVTTGLFDTGELLDHFLKGERINWQVLTGKNARTVQLTQFEFNTL